MRSSLLFAAAVAILAAAAFTALPSRSPACFVRSPQPVQVWLDHVSVEINDQVATKTYHCTFLNPNTNAVVGGVCYMELEPGAQVHDMVITVNGKESKAEILDVEKANEVFQEMVKEGASPALLEYYGNQLIQTQVPNIPAGGTVTVKLTYSMVLKKQGDLVRLQMLNTNPKADMKPLKAASVKVKIRSQTPIKNIYSPTHAIKIGEEAEWDVVVDWAEEEYLPKHPFVLYYQTAEEQVGATLLAHREMGEDGHFMFMVSPTMGQGEGAISESDILPKDVVFCVDTSGSMLQDGGKKMQQAQDALRYCLRHLRTQDRFNIVDFGTGVRQFEREGLVSASSENVQAALRYVDKISARGGTAMDEALAASVDLLGESNRLKMILFATDGLPTIGERDPQKILDRLTERNDRGVRMFVFGEGVEVNTKLLDLLALGHRGEAAYILPDEDIEEKIAGFYDRVGSPVMTDLKIEFDGLKTYDVLPPMSGDIYRGEQVILYGRYEGSGEKTVRLTGRTNGREQTFTYQVEFPDLSSDDKNSFVPRLWAGQMVDFLLTEIRKSGTEDEELVREVTFLAKRYGIVTPYTSFLMVEETCNYPLAQQVQGFSSRLRDEGNLLGKADGYSAVWNARQQAVNRGANVKSGAAENLYAQAEVAMKQEGRGGESLAAIRYVGSRCFYNARGRWYDSRYDDTQQSALQNVEIGSQEYLDLLSANPSLAKYMAQGDVVVEMNGQWYQFNQRRG